MAGQSSAPEVQEKQLRMEVVVLRRRDRETLPGEVLYNITALEARSAGDVFHSSTAGLMTARELGEELTRLVRRALEMDLQLQIHNVG